MSAVTSNRILSIYKSRVNILEILKSQKYDVAEYEEFSINEIDAMNTNSQLDMLVNRESDNTKIYIKYLLNIKQIRRENLGEIIEDLFTIENILSKKDTLLIIANEEPNETILSKCKYLYDHEGVFVVIHNIRRLQFNILNHNLVPEISILNEPEVDELKKKYNLKTVLQLPEISRFDPQALAVALRPNQVCKLVRKSATAMSCNYYRVCV